MSISNFEAMSIREIMEQEAGYHLRRNGIEPDLIAERADRIMEDHAELSDILEDCLPRPIAEFLAHAAIHWSPKMGGEWAYYGHKSDELLRELVHAWCKQEAGA